MRGKLRTNAARAILAPAFGVRGMPALWIGFKLHLLRKPKRRNAPHSKRWREVRAACRLPGCRAANAFFAGFAMHDVPASARGLLQS
jgi:hypothetical protein